MYPNEYILEQHIVMRMHKEHMWYDHHVNDPPPAMAVRWRDMQVQSINLGSIIYGLTMQARRSKRPTKQLEQALRPESIVFGVLAMITEGEKYPPEITPPPKRDTPLEEVWLALEGYRQPTGLDAETATVGDVIDTLREIGQVDPGDMEERYKNDPDSGIYEILTTYMFITGPLGTPEWSRTTSGVHKGDGGRLVWDEAEIVTSDDDEYQLVVIQDNLIPIISKFVRRENLS